VGALSGRRHGGAGAHSQPRPANAPPLVSPYTLATLTPPTPSNRHTVSSWMGASAATAQQVRRTGPRSHPNTAHMPTVHRARAPPEGPPPSLHGSHVRLPPGLTNPLFKFRNNAQVRGSIRGFS
jgi:hypothetical protein